MFSRQLIEAQEDERRRISRELHDQIGQILTAIKMNLYTVQEVRSTSRILTITRCIFFPLLLRASPSDPGGSPGRYVRFNSSELRSSGDSASIADGRFAPSGQQLTHSRSLSRLSGSPFWGGPVPPQGPGLRRDALGPQRAQFGRRQSADAGLAHGDEARGAARRREGVVPPSDDVVRDRIGQGHRCRKQGHRCPQHQCPDESSCDHSYPFPWCQALDPTEPSIARPTTRRGVTTMQKHSSPGRFGD